MRSVSRFLVPEAGLEPARLSTVDFESTASTIPPLGQVHKGRLNGPCTIVNHELSHNDETFLIQCSKGIALVHAPRFIATRKPFLALLGCAVGECMRHRAASRIAL